nr:T9SS type A sorting domain-containing protein [Bacteroidales bacterium]
NIYYNTAGLYSVTLTATNSYSSNVKTKISYITVTEGECKKTNYPITGTLWTMRAYFDNSFFGYVSGNNKGKDKAKADYFSLNSSFPYIMGAYFTIGKATKKTSGDVNVTFNVWSSVSGKPGSIIASANASLATLVSDYQNTKDTYIQFDYPVKVTGGYFVGVVLPTNAGDTLALKSNHQNESITNTAWELWSDNTWHAYDESGCWGFKLSNAIYPYLCDTYTDISKKNHPLFPDFIIYPNPANDKLNIQFNKTLYSISFANYSFNIYNTLGSIVKTGLLNDNSIDIKNLPVGFYYLKLSNENSSSTKKFFITN